MMNNKKLVLLTGNDSFFGQTRKPWVSMNVNKMIDIFQQEGFKVEKYSFPEIVNRQTEIRDSIIFYTFSQKVNRRDYIKDVVHYLDNGSNILIPSYELLKCHENKGYQEMYKKKIGLTSLKSFYFSSEKELPYYEIKFPIVLKTVDTSNGKGVFLISNREHLSKIIDKLEKQSFLMKLDLIRRRYFRRKQSFPYYPEYNNMNDYIQYRDYILKEKNFILQEFVPNLTFDYRVLVLFDKYYVMKRHTKKNDFRASGTKIHNFDIEVNDELLDYSKEVYKKFDSPFLSLDIGIFQNKYYLFEFQALHFGVNVLIKNKGYYAFDNNHWHFNPCKPDIETEITNSFIKYVKARYS